MALIQFYNGTHTQFDSDPTDPKWPITISLMACSCLSLIACSVIVGSIIYSKKTRVEGFNLYLVFLLLPDICFSAWNIIEMMETVILGSWPRRHQCVIGLISVFSYIGMNSWINVLVGREIFQMLSHSNQVRRFKTSSRGIVVRNASLAYLVSLIFGILTTVNTKPVMDIKLDSHNCYPRCQDGVCQSIHFTILVLISILPSICIIYFTFAVYKRNLLPPAGKCRFLSIYFLRIAFISVLFVLATVVATVFEEGGDFLYFFCACQGIIVSYLSYSKRDIKEAIKDTFSCNLRSSAKEDEITTRKTTDKSGC